MKIERQIRIIDKRTKEKFIIDDLYLNGYARVLGWKATIVYLSLCRHANKDQYSFPSIIKMAKEHNVSKPTIIEGLKILKKYNLIDIIKLKDIKGKFRNNTYVLLDKSVWKPVQVNNIDSDKPSPSQYYLPIQVNIIDPKETHRKETHINMSQDDKSLATDWLGIKEEVDKLLKDRKRYIQIIGIWIREMELKPENKKQLQSIIKRNVRPAKLLEGYKDADIIETIGVLKSTDWLRKFTLETILKFIDEIIKTKRSGSKIIKWERVYQNGKEFMKPIYE